VCARQSVSDPFLLWYCVPVSHILFVFVFAEKINSVIEKCTPDTLKPPGQEVLQSLTELLNDEPNHKV
jgi:hypothetical protein